MIQCRCDRCQKVFTASKDNIITSIRVYDLDAYNDVFLKNSMKVYELCPECVKEFAGWFMKGRPESLMRFDGESGC